MYYGLSQEESAQLEAQVDRPQSGLSPLERKAILNAARAGNVEAIRCIESVLVAAGQSRAAARRMIGRLRETKDATNDAEAFHRFLTTIQGLKL